jgi:hypothetical protein
MKAQREIFLVLTFIQMALVGTVTAADPEVISWGLNYSVDTTTNTPPGLSNVVAVDTVPALELALLADGTIAAWGDNTQGQLDAIARLTNVVAMSGGFTHVLSVKSDGTVGVAAWGNNQDFKTNIPPGLSNVVSVAAGGSQSLALLSDGTVASWGAGGSGTIPFVMPPGLSSVVDVQATLAGGLVLKADGTVTALGDNFATPPPPGLSNIVAISTAFAEDFMALRNDGTVVTWTARSGLAGYRDPLPAPPFPDPLLAINMEHYHSLGIAQDGTFRVWKLRDGPVTPPEPYLQIPQETATGVIAFAPGREYNITLVGEFGWPQITSQPQSLTTTDGQAAIFHVGATSALPLRYQWTFKGVNLTGETNATLILSGVNVTNAGPYGVAIWAGVRRIRSQPAWLTLMPTIQVQRVGAQVKLSWPMSGADYWLEEADDAAQPFRTAFENIVTNAISGRIEVAVNPSGHSRCFRLWQP